MRIIITNDYIKKIPCIDISGSIINFRIMQRDNLIHWNEIDELYATYVLYSDAPIIILKPKPWINKNKLTFGLVGMPFSLLTDIISHLPPDVKIDLYPRIKKQLEKAGVTRGEIGKL